MKIYKQQIFAICAVLYALALANGNEEFLSDEQRELFSTTITSDPRSCKLTCIDQGQQFCASPQYAQGYCCDKNYNCNQGAECSTQLPAATINSNLKYFPCPYASKCGGSKLITVTNSTSTLQYNRAAGSMTTGDVCGFRLTASNTSAANTIIITFKTLSGAQAFLYSGGSTYETATKQQLVDLNSNGGRYEFQGNTQVYAIITTTLTGYTTASYEFNYTLNIGQVTQPTTNGTSNSTNTNQTGTNTTTPNNTNNQNNTGSNSTGNQNNSSTGNNQSSNGSGGNTSTGGGVTNNVTNSSGNSNQTSNISSNFQKNSEDGDSQSSMIIIIAASAGGGVLVIAVVIVVFCMIRKRKLVSFVQKIALSDSTKTGQLDTFNHTVRQLKKDGPDESCPTTTRPIDISPGPKNQQTDYYTNMSHGKTEDTSNKQLVEDVFDEDQQLTSERKNQKNSENGIKFASQDQKQNQTRMSMIGANFNQNKYPNPFQNKQNLKINQVAPVLPEIYSSNHLNKTIDTVNGQASFTNQGTGSSANFMASSQSFLGDGNDNKQGDHKHYSVKVQLQYNSSASQQFKPSSNNLQSLTNTNNTTQINNTLTNNQYQNGISPNQSNNNLNQIQFNNVTRNNSNDVQGVLGQNQAQGASQSLQVQGSQTKFLLQNIIQYDQALVSNSSQKQVNSQQNLQQQPHLAGRMNYIIGPQNNNLDKGDKSMFNDSQEDGGGYGNYDSENDNNNDNSWNNKSPQPQNRSKNLVLSKQPSANNGNGLSLKHQFINNKNSPNGSSQTLGMIASMKAKLSNYKFKSGQHLGDDEDDLNTSAAKREKVKRSEMRREKYNKTPEKRFRF
eukprot:403376641